MISNNTREQRARYWMEAHIEAYIYGSDCDLARLIRDCGVAFGTKDQDWISDVAHKVWAIEFHKNVRR